uniref:(northern house mosquito) hypothetical protein n=1 Tax=Culex pipiens TaxID=7175 RepID=A0A8D8D5U8_CULPI
MCPCFTDSKASIIASSDHGVGFDRDNSIPSRLHRPYSVPVGMPNSVLAFCTDVWPALIASKARSRSSADQVVGAALNGAASRIPSRLAILYNVEDGIPNAFDALFAEIVPVRKASRALFSDSSFHVFDGPSFFGVSIPSLCALCHRVVDGIPYVAEALVRLMLWVRNASRADSISSAVQVLGPLGVLGSLVLGLVRLVYCTDDPSNIPTFESSLASD